MMTFLTFSFCVSYTKTVENGRYLIHIVFMIHNFILQKQL
jgi:hypothetical protein